MPNDPELETVKEALLSVDQFQLRAALVFRLSFDQIYNGQHTGYYRWDQLLKTEKTHFGTIIQINLHREFKFQDGLEMDYQIAGIDVDCKYSHRPNGWMIPPEAVGYLCLLLRASDDESWWSMGLVRITEDLLNNPPKGNRDKKRTLNPQGRDAITWVFRNAPLPPNVLLQLPRQEADHILNFRAGTKRVNQLFRTAQKMRVGRGVVATAAQQVDYMRRVRDGGGARGFLRPEGIIILGQYGPHVCIANDLGVPAPGPGESVSVRVSRAVGPGPGVAKIEDKYWKLATPDELPEPAPVLPKIQRPKKTSPGPSLMIDIFTTE